MTSPNTLRQPIQDPHIQAIQNTAAREAMRISNVEYCGQTLDGQLDPPVEAAKRMAMKGLISQTGLKLLIDADIPIVSSISHTT